MSLHPPHLIDSSRSLTPAALIPFCAYQTNMSLLGQTRQDLPFTVCSQFKPSVLEGQLCYSLDLNNIKTQIKTKVNLILLLDPSSSTSSHNPTKTSNLYKKYKGASYLNLDPLSHSSRNARIYLNTLASYTGYRAGSYAMSGLKKMTGTKNFLNLPEQFKKCQIESFEDCNVKRYLQEIQTKCKCVPWAFSSVVQYKEI